MSAYTNTRDAAQPEPLAHSMGLLALHNIPDLDALVRRAIDVVHVPIAVGGVVDGAQLHFLARHGLNPHSVPRTGSFCAEAIRQNGDLMVPNAPLDGRFADHALVSHAPWVRSYAGVVLCVHGQAVATLAVMDVKPRDFSGHEIDVLADLSILGTRWLEDLYLQRKTRQ